MTYLEKTKTRHKLAFNFKGIAYDHQTGDLHEQWPMLRCAKLLKNVSKSLATVMKEGNYQIPEILPPGEGVQADAEEDVLWVGMRPTLALEYTQTALSSKDKTEKPAKGRPIADNEAYHCLQHDKEALRVVVSTNQEVMHLCFYVVLNNKSAQRCEAFGISAEEVFFFPKYRNDAHKSFASRKSQWPMIIKNLIIASPGRQESLEEDGERARLDIARLRSHAAELIALGPEDPQWLRGIENQLKLIIEDVKNSQAFIYPGLKKLIMQEDGDAITLQESEGIKIDILDCWPELTMLEIRAEEIMTFHRCIQAAGLAPELSLFRPFLVQWTMDFRQKERSDPVMTQMTIDCYNHVVLLMGTTSVFTVSKASVGDVSFSQEGDT